MKKIELEEHKKIMLEILKYFDKICRDNNIKYSLSAGSLIGAVRHHGIIPWDNDIDVVLDAENYKKVLELLTNNKDSNYKLLYNKINRNYYPPFPKLVDTRTYLIEEQLVDPIEGYGVYIDIFCYNNITNDEKERKKQFKKLVLLNSMLSRKKYNFKKDSLVQNIKRFFKNTISRVMGYNRINDILEKENNKYNSEETDYIVSNWPIYGYQKEIQEKKNIKEYMDIQFEDMTAMIFKNYDEILKTTFGNYMELPPEEDRKTHGLIAYWR